MAEAEDDPRAERAPPSDLRRIGSTPAFASRIDAYAVPDHAKLNEALLAAIVDWRAGNEGMRSSNYLGWHSPRELFQREEPAFQLLASHIKAAAAQSIRHYWPEFDPERDPTVWEGWVNINGTGAYNGPHGHSSNHLAGAYYVKTPATGDSGSSGAIEFLNPAGALTRLLPFGRKLVATELRVRPRPGQMLIFPAYLRHWVYANHESEERVSISFNVLVAAENVN